MIYIDIKDDGRAEVRQGGETRTLQHATPDEAQAAVVALLAEYAQQFGEKVYAITSDEPPTYLTVTPTGEVTPSETNPQPAQTDARAAETAPAVEDLAAVPEIPAKPPEAPAPFAPVASTPSPTSSNPLLAAAPAQQPAPQGERTSFLTTQRHEEPAQKGWRGGLTRIGIRVAPGPEERLEREDRALVSQHWPGPRTIAVVNGKGGASKTPTTILLSAIFARFGGGGVLSWDNNQTRGTLGWRTEQGAHQGTILDLLPQAERLLAPGAQAADLAHYVHHQTADRFDVLRSKPMVLSQEQRVTPTQVETIHSVASKFYRLVIIDSGNDESDPVWKQMIHQADQIVVPTTTRDEHAEAGALLLEALGHTGEHGARLAQRAVVVVSQAESQVSKNDRDHIIKGFQSMGSTVVPIPFDPAMVDGHLTYGSLKPITQRAWLRAGAAVARGLDQT